MSWNHILRKTLTMNMVIAICLAGSTLAQRTVYVDGSVATSGDGSQAAPFKTIDDAISLTDSDLTILVAGGTYTNEPNYRRILSGQTLIGSYDSSFTTSDPAVTPTIIDMARPYADQTGAYRIDGVSDWTLMNLVIVNSSTGEGNNTNNAGAIYIRNGSQGTLRGITFYNCTARFEGGGESGTARDGGALCIRDDSNVVIEDCIFDHCTAVGNGGALRIRSARGAGNNVKIHRCLFAHCGSRGGASVIDDADGRSQIEITNSIFAHNGEDVDVSAGTYPSHYLLRLADRKTLLYNCTFVDNTNPDGYLFDVADSGDSSGVKNIINCIFTNNTITSGGSNFSIFKYVDDYNDVITIQNNLFFSNSGLEPLDYTGAPIIGVNDNITGDPQFTDEANDDYHLMTGSPGEDAGQTLALVTDDFAGTTRPVGAAYDIGAYEGHVMSPSYDVQSIIATASSEAGDSVAQKTVDGSGLNALDQHDTLPANMWISSSQDTSPWIQYEFDRVYKLDQMDVWNSNSSSEWLNQWGVKTATIEISTDGTMWTTLAEVPEFAQASGLDDYASNTTVDFNGVAAKFVKITCNSSWGGNRCSLSEVRFSYVPVAARNPNPANNATDVSPDAALSWTAGQEAVSHEITLGSDMQAVADSTTPDATVSQTTYAPDLQPNTTYYWKVAEVNDAESPSTWSSPVWSFTTASDVVVDDFETYGQLSPNQLYQTWLDSLGFSPDQFFPNGYNGNGTGAIVGNDPSAGPILEYKIVYSGHRSMPLSYHGLSETTRTFESAQDWTRHDITTLVIHFYGTAGNTGQLYVKIGNTKIPYSGNASDIAKEGWTTWNIDLASSGASLTNVSSLTIGVDGNGSGQLYIDDILLQ